MIEQRVLLTLDELPVPAGEPSVLLLADFIERLAQMPDDVELVKEHGRLGSLALRPVSKRFPHVHDCHVYFFRAVFPAKIEEFIHTFLAPVHAPEPNGPSLLKIAHDDPVLMPLFDRDLVDPDHSGRRLACALELCCHIPLVQLLDRVPVEHVLVGHILDCLDPALGANHVPESFGAKGAVEQPLQSLAPHAFALSTADATDIHFEIDPVVAAGEVTDLLRLPIVPALVSSAAGPTHRFF